MAELRFSRTEQILNRVVSDRVAPGAVAAIWNFRDSASSPWMRVVGSRRVEPSVQPLFLETVFDLASLTKPLVTATLVARLIERGLLEWRTPVCSVFPQAPATWRKIEIWHLLSHSAGFPAWMPFWQKLQGRWGDALPEVSIRSRASFVRDDVFSQHPEGEPGASTLYSDLSFLLLGFVIEEVLGQPLDRAWNSLGFEAGFRRVHRQATRRQPIDEQVAATELSEWRGGYLQGEVHDENCWAMGGVGGHAGLFGSCAQVVAIVNAIFRGELFSAAVADLLFARITPARGSPRSLGWDIPTGEGSSAGRTLALRAGVVGHLGFTGTSLWVDRQSGWVFLLLTNRVHLGRESLGIRAFRPAFHEAAVADLGIDRLSTFERR